MKIVLIVLLCAFAATSGAAEDEAKEPKAETEPTVSESTPDTDKVSEREPQAPDASPESERLKNRSVGAALGRFRPSEEISADNAVPFPVDI